MNVASYIYQSPSPSATQVGRLDPSSVKEEAPAKEEASATTTDTSLDTSSQVQKDAQSFAATQTNKVAPSVESGNLLDLYA